MSVYWRGADTFVASKLPSLDPLSCTEESCLKPASRKHCGQSIWMEFRLPGYGTTVLVVPPFREEIVRLHWCLICACSTRVVQKSYDFPPVSSPRGHEQEGAKVGDLLSKQQEEQWMVAGGAEEIA